MEMTLVQEVQVVAVLNALVAAAGPVPMRVVGMNFVCHSAIEPAAARAVNGR
ncbi:MAG: hypothetical protein ACLPSH_16200 [Vulcanimicrobiaceae bacterium]|jgi:hypothetical protein